MTARRALVQAVVYWLLLQAVFAVLLGLSAFGVWAFFGRMSVGVLIGGGIAWAVFTLGAMVPTTIAYDNAKTYGTRTL